MGSLLLFCFNSEIQGEDPAKLSQIEAAVETIVTKVIQDETNRSEARKATSAIMFNTRNFLQLGDLVASDPAGTEHFATDLERLIHACIYGGDNSLGVTIEQLNNEPEVAKFILPVYAMGIGTLLQAKRLHYLDAALKGSPVSAKILKFFEGDLLQCRSGLAAGKAAFVAYRDNKMKEDHTFFIPEGQTVREIFNRTYLGEPSLDKIDQCISALDETLTLIRSDISGPIKYFWNPAWKIPKTA